MEWTQTWSKATGLKHSDSGPEKQSLPRSFLKLMLIMIIYGAASTLSMTPPVSGRTPVSHTACPEAWSFLAPRVPAGSAP